MFRTGLLVSTAMTAVALLLSGAPTGAYAQSNMHVASRDPNTRFLCTYGQFAVSRSHIGESGYFFNKWTHVAVPVLGHGKVVQTIEVEEQNSGGFSGELFAGVYSNTASGLPGNLIAGGSASAASGCTKVQIPISPTTLLYHKTYWIVEQVYPHGHATKVLYWAADPKTNRKAYVQHHSSSEDSYSYTSPWTKQAMGPYVRLR